jgi:hypothetical protein
MAAARSNDSGVVARNKQFRRLPVLRPVLPSRCKNDDTLAGASI